MGNTLSTLYLVLSIFNNLLHVDTGTKWVLEVSNNYLKPLKGSLNVL